MAARKTPKVITETKHDIPQNLKGHMFFGLPLNDEQIAFRDAIWDRDTDIVFCNAKPGAGKSLVTVATAMLMYEYGIISGIIYMSAADCLKYGVCDVIVENLNEIL